jgi:hypothetical protein
MHGFRASIRDAATSRPIVRWRVNAPPSGRRSWRKGPIAVEVRCRQRNRQADAQSPGLIVPGEVDWHGDNLHATLRNCQSNGQSGTCDRAAISRDDHPDLMVIFSAKAFFQRSSHNAAHVFSSSTPHHRFNWNSRTPCCVRRGTNGKRSGIKCDCCRQELPARFPSRRQRRRVAAMHRAMLGGVWFMHASRCRRYCAKEPMFHRLVGMQYGMQRIPTLIRLVQWRRQDAIHLSLSAKIAACSD